jgi:hypothetical protein
VKHFRSGLNVCNCDSGKWHKDGCDSCDSGQYQPNGSEHFKSTNCLDRTVSEVLHEGHIVDEFILGLGQLHESDHQHERGKNSLNDPECNVHINPP